MDNQILNQIKGVLDKNDAVSIIVGKNPNLDEMAAALSLYLSLQQIGKAVGVACPTDPLVEISSLVGIDKVKKNIDAAGTGGDLVVSFPYKDGEIEKVSYTLDEGYLNIVVKSGENGLSFADEDVRFQRGGGSPKALFIIGTSRLADLGNLFNPEALKDTTVVNIDNQSDNQGFGDVVFVSQNYSSVSEQVASLIEYLGIDIDIDIAQNLMSGISFGTENFQSDKTSSFAFEMAGVLMKKGAVRQQQTNFGPQPKPMESFSDDEDYEDDLSAFTKPTRLQPKWNQPQTQNQPQSQSQSQPRVQSGFSRTNQQGQSQQSGGGFNQPNSGFNQNSGGQQQRKPFPKPFNQRFNQNQQSGGGFNQPKKQSPVGQQPQGNQSTQNDDDDAPSDWLTPKIYKGSSNVE